MHPAILTQSNLSSPKNNSTAMNASNGPPHGTSLADYQYQLACGYVPPTPQQPSGPYLAAPPGPQYPLLENWLPITGYQMMLSPQAAPGGQYTNHSVPNQYTGLNHVGPGPGTNYMASHPQPTTSPGLLSNIHQPASPRLLPANKPWGSQSTHTQPLGLLKAVRPARM